MSIEEALDVCTHADRWIDEDGIKLYRAAEILARAYDKVSYQAALCCGVCYNSEFHNECWRLQP